MTSPQQQEIIQAIQAKRPLTGAEGLILYREFPLSLLQELADSRRREYHGENVYFNRNIHIEPTNRCVYSCKFCAFYRKPKATEKEGAWDYSHEEIENILDEHQAFGITEVHVTGGVHPDHDLEWWAELIRRLKRRRPDIHVKAYTAVEIAFMARQSGKSFAEVLQTLKAAGLDSLPGGGAEIFDAVVRRKIAGGKAPTNHWLEIHRTAHELGLTSNATMLYGHIETYEQRLEHMLILRQLQAQTHGFNAFIPLKYRNGNNALSSLPEITEEEDLKNYAVSRLMLENFKHLKAYWVMLGLDTAKKALNYGVDDLDGTVNDTTKIYSMAGSIQKPTQSQDQLRELILSCGRVPVERNSVYQQLKSGS